MTVAGKKNARWQGGQVEGQYSDNSLYSNNIARIHALVNGLAQKWNMDKAQIENVAVVWGIMFRDSAPKQVQPAFTGKPSAVAPGTRILAAAFFVIYTKAVDRMQGLGSDDAIDAAACWQAAIELVGGWHAE